MKKENKKYKLKISKVKKTLFYKLNLHLYLKIILLILSLFLIFSIYNFYLISEIKSELKNNYFLELIREEKNQDRSEENIKNTNNDNDSNKELVELNKLENTKNEENAEKAEENYSKVTVRDEPNIGKKYTVSSFGDNFSGNAYLNFSKTNMYLDELITALTFQPEYNFEKIKVCDNLQDCLPLSNLQTPSIYRTCIKGECLELRGNEVYFKNTKLILPKELKNENILRMSVSGLDSKWLLGVVVGSYYDEAGFVFSFNGVSFSTLISRETDNKILPKYDRLGGYIGFGGEDDNFLVIYAGYKGIAYQIKEGQFYNLSQFFGFRVTDPSFIPYVIKTREGNNSSWYVGSLTNNKPKLIKLWQNNTEIIKGALDFSDLVFKKNSLRRGVSYLFLPFSLEKNIYVVSNGALYTFSDLGFENDHDYQAVSVNIQDDNQGDNQGDNDINVVSSVFKDLKISINQDDNLLYISDFSKFNNIHLYLSNQENEWGEVDYKKSYYFKDREEKNLYWKIEFKNKLNDKYYSPWLDSVDDLTYSYFY